MHGWKSSAGVDGSSPASLLSSGSLPHPARAAVAISPATPQAAAFFRFFTWPPQIPASFTTRAMSGHRNRMRPGCEGLREMHAKRLSCCDVVPPLGRPLGTAHLSTDSPPDWDALLEAADRKS